MKFLALFFLSSNLFANKVSLLQNRSGLICQEKSSKPKLIKATLNEHDEKLELSWKGQKTQRFETERFMDIAVMMKEKGGNKAALFHVYANGEVMVLIGSRYKMRERLCKDTGASKRCGSDDKRVESFFYSSEKMELKLKSEDLVKTKVNRYGVFPNDGTYVYGASKGKKTIAMVDYGSNFSLILGHRYMLKCKYGKVTNPDSM